MTYVWQGKARLPLKGPNSPYSPGTRTVLARTCKSCGQLADGDSFPLISGGRGGRRHTCHNCTNEKKKQDREQRGIGIPRPPEKLQTSKYRLWTAEDDKYLRDHVDTMSYENIAIALGRSLRSVYKRRSDLGLAAVRKKHRVEKPWRISEKD